MQLTTGYPTYLYNLLGASARIVCPVAERQYAGYVDLVTPYGFSGFVGMGDCAEFPRYWREFTNSRHYVCGYIALNPVLSGMTYTDPRDVYQPNTLFYMDLAPAIDDLLQKVDRDRRRELRRFERVGPAVTFDKEALRPFVLTHHSDFMELLGASRASRFSRATLDMLFTFQKVVIIGAEGSEGIEAAGLFGYTPYMADYFINIAIHRGRRTGSLLLWSGVRHFKALGVPWLNLGGGVREGDSVAAHKRPFGPRELPFRCLKQIYRPDVYAHLCARAGVDGSEMTGYFPAYRQTVEN
jgi:hypothetical protein